MRPDTASHDRELFQLIFRAAPDIISIIDPDRGQLLVNEAAERILGHSMTRPEDSRGLVHPDDLARVEADLSPREDGFGGPVRYRVRTIWGEWRWLESNSTDLTGVPPVSGLLVFSRDVTARCSSRSAWPRARPAWSRW